MMQTRYIYLLYNNNIKTDLNIFISFYKQIHSKLIQVFFYIYLFVININLIINIKIKIKFGIFKKIK